MEIKEARCFGFDILKILSMFLIVCFHCAYKGGFNIQNNFINQVILDALFYLGLLGTNCFALITGMFYKRMFFKKNKFIKMLFQIAFYTTLSIAILLLTGHDISVSTILYRLFPFDAYMYWYATAYLLLLLFAPYLNIMIEHMDKKQYQMLIIMSLMLFSIMPTIKTVIWQTDFMEHTNFYNRFIWVVIMYLIGAYIEKWGFPLVTNMRKAVECLCLSICALLSFILMTNIINSDLSTVFFSPNSPFEIFLSISLFSVFYFAHAKPRHSATRISKLTFGVYLLHDGLLDTWIWQEIFKINQFQNQWYMIFSIFIASALVFAIGLCVEFLRQRLETYIEIKMRKSS